MSKLALLGGKPVFEKNHPWPRWPQTDARDRRRLQAVLDDGRYGIGAPVIEEFGRAFGAYAGTRYALPVNSGTAALELTVKSLDIGPGDEVIVPSYTFVATATSVLELGATVVFSDIDPRTMNLDPASVARLITSRTKAIVPVHFGGNPVAMTALRAAIGTRKISLIEDAAHAHGMLLRGKAAGHHGVAASYSFQSSKNMSGGEGGILVTNSKELYEHAWSYHSFGRKMRQKWYGHHTLSWNHRMSAFQAAVLLGELERLESQTVKRHHAGAFLNRALAQIPGIEPQAAGDTHPRTRRAYHLYIWRVNPRVIGMTRDTFLKALAAEGVAGSGGYDIPLQEQPMFRERRFWHRQGRGGGARRPGEPEYRHVQTPHAKRACSEIVWLPHAWLLAGRRDLQGIVDAVAKVVANARDLR